jgi:hypothetical protein
MMSGVFLIEVPLQDSETAAGAFCIYRLGKSWRA